MVRRSDPFRMGARAVHFSLGRRTRLRARHVRPSEPGAIRDIATALAPITPGIAGRCVRRRRRLHHAEAIRTVVCCCLRPHPADGCVCARRVCVGGIGVGRPSCGGRRGARGRRARLLLTSARAVRPAAASGAPVIGSRSVGVEPRPPARLLPCRAGVVVQFHRHRGLQCLSAPTGRSSGRPAGGAVTPFTVRAGGPPLNSIVSSQRDTDAVFRDRAANRD
jgi:hypothetical protein